MKTPNKKLTPNAQILRKNMTKEERHLWYDFLSTYPIQFKRQKVVGRYIADFFCPKAKIIIEIDGSQHFSEDGLQYDKERTDFLNKFGIMVIRLTNIDINQRFRSSCEFIDLKVKERL
ncbi:MAG: endonuclease domain-containing protein [Clostridia bacterium]|nr:endonuclease domain-containing protein [Clostridia bacterium]